MSDSPTPAPSILGWINSPRLRAFELWLWRRPKIAWAVFGLSVFLIFLPGTGGALWYSFNTEPPIPTILKKLLLISQEVHLSASWITVPIGLVMFAAMFYLLVMGRRQSKTGEISEEDIGEAPIRSSQNGYEAGLAENASAGTGPCAYQWVHEIADYQAVKITDFVKS